MKIQHKFFTVFLLTSLTFLFAKAQSGPVHFPIRPYRYNPGALCYDSLSAVSFYTRFRPAQRFQSITISNAYLEGWMSAELKLPGKTGALGLQAGFTDYIGVVWETRNASISYAYSFQLAGGKMGIGLQADFKYFKEAEDSTLLWYPRPLLNGEDFRPDLSAGVFYQIGNFSAGISGHKLLANRLRINAGNTEIHFSAERAIISMVGYQRRLNNKWRVSAVTALRSIFTETSGIRSGIQLNITGIYRDKYHLGVSPASSEKQLCNLNTGIRIGGADVFTILPVPLGFYLPKDFQFGFTYRINS